MIYSDDCLIPETDVLYVPTYCIYVYIFTSRHVGSLSPTTEHYIVPGRTEIYRPSVCFDCVGYSSVYGGGGDDLRKRRTTVVHRSTYIYVPLSVFLTRARGLDIRFQKQSFYLHVFQYGNCSLSISTYSVDATRFSGKASRFAVASPN